MDGASERRILFQIVIPMSLPAIATMGLFYAVSHWNEFFRGIFYIYDPEKWPLQVLLRSVVIPGQPERDRVQQPRYVRQCRSQPAYDPGSYGDRCDRADGAPYPFVQRFFVQGIVLGAEKG